MNDWLSLMLDEIRRKQRERMEALQEHAQREQAQRKHAQPEQAVTRRSGAAGKAENTSGKE